MMGSRMYSALVRKLFLKNDMALMQMLRSSLHVQCSVLVQKLLFTLFVILDVAKTFSKPFSLCIFPGCAQVK